MWLYDDDVHEQYPGLLLLNTGLAAYLAVVGR